MKNRLVSLLISAITIFEFTSYNPHANSVYIPCINELRAIEKEKPSKNYDCKHKSVKYQNILKENGETANVILGWKPEFENWHTLVGVLNEKTGAYHLIDPSFSDNIDGFPRGYYSDLTIFYVFNENAIVEDIDKKDPRKNYKKRFTENIKEYLANKQK